MAGTAPAWDAGGMKKAVYLVATVAIAAAALGWIPQEKGKRKMRMAATATACQPV
jgi:hypothetical protein